MGERGQHGLGRGVHGAARPLVPAPGGPRRVERFGGRRGFEDARNLTHLLRVDPAHHVGHGAAVQRRRQEERGQQLGGRGVPELAVGRRPVGLGGVAQVRRHPAGLPPLQRSRSAATRRRRARRWTRWGRCTTPGPAGRASPSCAGAGHPSRWRPPRARATRGWPAPPGSSSSRSGSGPPRRRTGPSRPRRPSAAPRRGGRRGGGGRPEGGRPSPPAGGGRAASPSARPGARRAVRAAWRPRPGRGRRSRASSAPPKASGKRPRRCRPPASGRSSRASVSTMRPSVALRRCCTRKDRWPTFHRAMPRRSCGSSSASVPDSDRSSAAASSSPGDWA